jgi:hypothetical protein
MKHILYLSLKLCVGMWMTGNAIWLSWAYPALETSMAQLSNDVSPQRNCPPDLSNLQSRMEEVLRFVKSSSFKESILRSLHASIPEAIAQTDGLSGHIAFLQEEIVRQEQERIHAEEVAGESREDPSKPLVPCPREMEGSYCHAVDQYYMSIAANLANRAFLDALECYQREESH